MKKLISTILLAYISGFVYAQDLVVTTNKNSLKDQITQINPDYINAITYQKTAFQTALTPVSSAETYAYNSFPNMEMKNSNSYYANNRSFPRFRIALGGGLGYRLAAVSSEISDEFLRNYIKKLKLGYQFNVDAAGYFNRYVGLGVKANVFKASNEEFDVIQIDQQTGAVIKIGEMSNKTTTLFVSPAFFARFISERSGNALVMSASIGYIHYWDNAVFGTPYLLEGGTLGISYDIGYDFRLNEFLLIGLQGGFTLGTLSSYRQTSGGQTVTVTLEDNNQESLFRVDLSVGLRFSKGPDRFR
jgi:hypothetical protein